MVEVNSDLAVSLLACPSRPSRRHAMPALPSSRQGVAIFVVMVGNDACICVSSETALGVEHKTTHAAGLLLQFCEQHALPPNPQRGKTEILFAFQGAESRKLKKKYFGPTHFGSLSMDHG